MRVLIDINVVIDLLTNRESFAEQARQVFIACGQEEIEGVLSACEVPTIFYLLQRHVGKEAALEHMRTLTQALEIVDVNSTDVEKALRGDMPDFEDAVLAHSAKRAKARYIITRDLKDFSGSPVPAISPTDFIQQHPIT